MHALLKNCSVKSGAIVLGALLVLIVLSKWTGSDSPRHSRAVQKRIRRLFREAERLNAQCRQDSSPVMALMHSTTAVAYVDAARALSRDRDLEKITGVHPDELLYYLQEDQQACTQACGDACPGMVPQSTYLT